MKGLAVGGASLAGVSGFTMKSSAQNGEIPAPFCGEASLPPQNPPGGQAGQCIGCVEDVCDGPTALEPLFSGLSGTCFTLPAEDIPEGADYLTLKAGQNCFLAEVPDNLSGDVTFCLEQVDGQPPMLQDISNATFYTCAGEDPQLPRSWRSPARRSASKPRIFQMVVRCR
ncbi:hypothetical protein ACFQL7_07195 [Halocatena marina]|uniref:Uncharacterized protein n=1 Tax=Halocatena marina TaxID=2934937 RepID=A0ABD5YQZ1_9EURY